jgi:hypothetical protein
MAGDAVPWPDCYEMKKMGCALRCETILLRAEHSILYSILGGMQLFFGRAACTAGGNKTDIAYGYCTAFPGFLKDFTTTTCVFCDDMETRKTHTPGRRVGFAANTIAK